MYINRRLIRETYSTIKHAADITKRADLKNLASELERLAGMWIENVGPDYVCPRRAYKRRKELKGHE